MILLVIMLAYIFYFLYKNIDNKEVRKKVIIVFAVAVLFQAILLLIYRLDLKSLNRDVYYSDAGNYWQATLDVLNGKGSNAYNEVYYITCSVIQKLSPFVWVGWNNIFNLLCVDLSIALCAVSIYKFLSKKNDKNRRVQTIIFCCINLFNPLICYSLMRNLKDALFFLLVVIIGHGLQYLLENKSIKNSIIYMIKLAICSMLLMGIRPWGILAAFIPIAILIIQKNKENYEKNAIKILAILLVITGIVLGERIWSTFKLWVPIVLESAISRGIFSNIKGVATLVLGPRTY